MRLRRIFAASIGLALLPALTAASDDPVSSDVVTVLQSVTSAQEEDIPAAPETVDELLEAEGVEILDDPRGLLGTDSPSVQDSNEEAPPVLPAQEADDEQLREQVDAQNGIWYSDEAPVAQDDSVTTNALSEPEPVRPAIEDCQAIYNGGWGVPAEPPGYSDKSGYQMTRLDWCYIGQATYRTITCDSSGSCRVT